MPDAEVFSDAPSNTGLVAARGDLLISPRHASVESVASALARIESAGLPGANMAAGSFWTEFEGTEWAWLRPYKVSGGVLTIPVKGVLMKDFPYAYSTFATGYEYITAAVKRGVEDPDVHEIILDVDSLGGFVAGCFDCADSVFAARNDKTIRAYANESAYSGAYAIASAASEIVVARTGGVGSIGVVGVVTDLTRAYEMHGVRVIPVYAGKHKVDGSPFVPFSDEAKARYQEHIDSTYRIFVATVARNRGLEESAVRATEADCFTALEAIELGLADVVGSLGSLSALADHSNDNDEEHKMSKENQSVTMADHEAAVADAAAKATESGKREGASAERQRIAAILDSEEAKKRPAAARHVALHSDMSAEQAAAFLAGLPEEANNKAPSRETAARTPFEAAMEATPNPELGAGDGREAKKSVADEIFASAGFAQAVN